ncbi:MAG: aminotransferase class V-fold PLP-dependent enzyme, partial [Planctomycetaceae bacterium]
VFDESDQFYREHVQASESTLGIMASGGTAANITALWCARNACFGPRGGFAGIQNEGLVRSLDAYGYHDAVVLASSMAHYSIEKAAAVLGLGARHIVRIPVDEAGCLRPAALRKTVDACRRHRRRILAVIGVAGTTDSGCIDPLDEIARIAAAAGIHFHVDAAWGAPLLLTERFRSMLRGIERADSVTIDGHKQLHLPLGTSMLLLKDPHLARQIEHEAEYMLRPNSFDQGRHTLEGSRASTILFFNAALHLIGRRGFDALVEGHIRRAAEFAEMVNEAADFELLCRPQTSIVLYRYLPRFARVAASQSGDGETGVNAFNEQLQQAQFERGATFVSRTRLRCLPQFHSHPVVALRAVINHPLTSRADLQAVLDDQRTIAAEMERQVPYRDYNE